MNIFLVLEKGANLFSLFPVFHSALVRVKSLIILHHQLTQGPFTELPLSSEYEGGLQKPLLLNCCPLARQHRSSTSSFPLYKSSKARVRFQWEPLCHLPLLPGSAVTKQPFLQPFSCSSFLSVCQTPLLWSLKFLQL